MRRAARVDTNQADLVKMLRQLGMSVVLLVPLGKGVPDLLVGWRGRMLLVEVKESKAAAAAKSETADRQADFRLRWVGPPVVVAVTAWDVQRAFLEMDHAS